MTGFYLDAGKCVACIANALSCTSASSFTCKDGYSAIGGSTTACTKCT